MQASQWQTKGTKDWEVCSICWKPLSDDSRNNDYFCFLYCKRNYSQLSSSTIMSLNSGPTFVYRRRRQHWNSVAKISTEPFPNTEPNDHSISIYSEAPSPSSLQGIVSLTQTATEAVKSCTVYPVRHNTGDAGSSEGPTLVYRRRRQNRNSVAKSSTEPFPNTKPNDHSISIHSESPSPSSLQAIVSPTQTATEAVKSRNVYPVTHNTGDAGSSEGCFPVDRISSVEALKSNGKGCLDDPSVKDNCSSSKSVMELNSASLKKNLDDAGESSCSGKLITDNVPDEISERDKCISIVRSLGLLDRVWIRKEDVPSGINGVMNTNYCSKSCKVCKRLESTKNMLICDNCEDAFHVSCSNLRITSIPAGEWHCGSCLKKKCKLLRGKGSGSSSTELGSLYLMLTDKEPYMSKVRVGDEFQATVPYWSGPVNDECELTGDLLEVPPANHIPKDKEERISTKPLKLSVAGNWLQCQEIITGTGKDVDICGKWRRAPLFEVQTDEWECFDSIRWDPVHADCAAPQELDTEEIMKQLKLVEALKHMRSSPLQAAAKRQKLDCPKINNGL